MLKFWMRVAIDPLLYLFSLIIALLFFLDAMGTSFLGVMRVFEYANKSLAASQILSALIPMAIMSFMAVVISLMRSIASLKITIERGELMQAKALSPNFLYVVLPVLFSFLLLLVIIIQILEYKNLLQRSVPLDQKELYFYQACVILNIFFTTLVYLFVGAGRVLEEIKKDNMIYGDGSE